MKSIGIKFSVLSFLAAALLVLAFGRTPTATAAPVRAVVPCYASGGDRRAQNRIDAVRLTATVDQGQQQITLHWLSHNSGSYSYNVYRKTRASLDWGNPIATSLSSATTSYTDSTPSLGQAFEYRVQRNGSGCANQNGYIYVGLDADLIDQRGTLILLVDSQFSGSLSAELTLFTQDLIGEGWQVIRHDIPQSTSIPSVKQLIQTDYNADPTYVKAVFIVGHLAVPYSGNHATDGHDARAWPSDTYYGDMDGTWTDNSVNNSGMTNPNVPGDGVFDQTTITPNASGADTAPELMVGRIDMVNLTDFLPQTETDLLRRYFDKNHDYRHGITRVRQRALLMDKFGEGQGWETPGVAQWTSMTPLVGAGEGWFDGPNDNGGGQFESGIYKMHYRKDKYFNPAGYIMADVSGPSITNQMLDSYSTLDYKTHMPPVIFFNKFGSYFGDWDQWNDLLRASIAGETYGLATVWGGWGTWLYHHMGLGEPIGSTVLATHMASLDQSSGGDLYSTWYGHTRPEMSIMGDPTLRMHVVDPISNLNGQSRGAQLNWSAARETANLAGYHIYRADTPQGTFTRLTNNPHIATSYTDGTAGTGTYTYMVRAITLETTPSGTYYNASQGVFVTVNTVEVPTVVTLARNNLHSSWTPLIIVLFFLLLSGILGLAFFRKDNIQKTY